MRNAMGSHRPSFKPLGFRVIVEARARARLSEATVMVQVGDVVEHTAAGGRWSVNACSTMRSGKALKSSIRSSAK